MGAAVLRGRGGGLIGPLHRLRERWRAQAMPGDAPEAELPPASAQLLGIARRLQSRSPMETIVETDIRPEFGVFGDFRGRPKPNRVHKRQVSVLAREDWAAAEAELGIEIPWTVRRANLFVEGVVLPREPGSLIRIGRDVVLRVTSECDPCRRMDEQVPGLEAALTPDWRGGVLTTVIAGGHVRLGDKVRIEQE